MANCVLVKPYNFVAFDETIGQSWRVIERDDLVSGTGPVGEHGPEVGEWVAEGCEFPVEDGNDFTRIVHDGVVESIVAVHEAGWTLFGHSRDQLFVGFDNLWVGRGFDGLDLSAPTSKLAFEVALALCEIAEADFVDVDLMDLRQVLDDRDSHLVAYVE